MRAKSIQILMVVLAATLAALLYAFFAMKQASIELRDITEQRYESYLLADELRQSSDDLTRLARTYVVTADPEYERQYLHILDIRNGKAPRPQEYQRIYWDFVAAGNAKPRPDGPAISLDELMKKAGFAESEFVKLQQAQANSNDLVQLEVRAMHAVKGEFIDSQGNYTVKNEPDMALARNLLHSSDYHRFKGKIMAPLDDFFVLLDRRTANAVNVADGNLANAQYMFLIFIFLLFAEIGLLIYLSHRRLLNQLGAAPAEVDAVVNELAAGNLTTHIPQAPAGSVMSNLGMMNDKLKLLIGAALNTSQQLVLAIDDVAQMIDNTSDRTSQQNEMTDLVATAVNEMGLTVQEIARSANNTAQVTREALNDSQQASTTVQNSCTQIEVMASDIGTASNVVSQLAEQVASIDQVLAVIRNISEQTNLLALNAAIEAARAGEMGRGFAVVADEVRTLASRAQRSTDEIQHMIASLKQGAENAVTSMRSGQVATSTGVEASHNTNQLLQRIATRIEQISDMNQQAATATEEQSSVTEEINRNVQGIADLAGLTSSDIQICRDRCQALRKLSENLAIKMNSFSI
ncbi:methyl-accepting chemotaxis protein [Pseudomonas sp. NPDC086278]|uniref:methyl-accepting chemotaxis protein n=1 Tax=Pseudomonas sp. NPDC086278 TaxID=3390646 RepID=UPI003D062E1C